MFRFNRSVAASLGIGMVALGLAMAPTTTWAGEAKERRVSPTARAEALKTLRVANLRGNGFGPIIYMRSVAQGLAKPWKIGVVALAGAGDIATQGKLSLTQRTVGALAAREGLRMKTLTGLHRPGDKHYAAADLAALNGRRGEALKQRAIGFVHRVASYATSNFLFSLAFNTAVVGPEPVASALPSMAGFALGFGVLGSAVELLAVKTVRGLALNAAFGKAERALTALDRKPASEEAAIVAAQDALGKLGKAANAIPMLSVKQTARFNAIRARAQTLPGLAEAAGRL